MENEKRYLIAAAITNAAKDRSYRTGKDIYQCLRECFEETYNIQSWPIKQPSSFHQAAPITHNARTEMARMYLEMGRKYCFVNPSIGLKCHLNAERAIQGLPPIEIY